MELKEAKVGDRVSMHRVLGLIVMGAGVTAVILGVLSIVVMLSGVWKIFV
jgi:hypothetical protein